MKIARWLVTTVKTKPRLNLQRPVAIGILVLSLFMFSGIRSASAAQKSDFESVAKLIDLQLSSPTTLTESIDDATFLSRVSLDLVGRRPDAEQVRQFVRSSDVKKRSIAIQQLLADPRFGLHWGRYWRDTILARRSDERALKLVSTSLTHAVADRLNQNVGWDQIASDFITARGDVRSHGETALFLAQKGNPEGITAEVSRIFLGIQIQCAQCHDHPTDQWTREQFHQLAAFFPRVGIRRVRNEEPRNFEVFSRNNQGRGKKSKNRKKLEYFTPDLAMPDVQGRITKPVFFLTGHSLELGTQDQIRRQTLAEWLTATEKNPWFARAYVNRIWTELMGWGFYDTVDDIGPERDCANADILGLLETHFVASGYDTKWLFNTILSTAAYQAISPATGRIAGPQPLRGDAVFNNLTQVLQLAGPERKGGKNQTLASQKQLQKKRQVFVQQFFYDPSLPRSEINPTIPEALLMMNSPQINALIRGDREQTMLGRLLRAEPENKNLVETLYLSCLGRFPTDQEERRCLEYMDARGIRREACEDILWSLLNTAAFRQRN